LKGKIIPKDFAVGKDTRFKMSKNTLKNDTLNGTYPPKELAPSKETSLKGKGVTNVFRPNKTPVGLGILINYHT